MRFRCFVAVTALLSMPAISLSAQQAVIKRATPNDVVQAVSNELSSQGASSCTTPRRAKRSSHSIAV
jgi:hypothetical protein